MVMSVSLLLLSTPTDSLPTSFQETLESASEMIFINASSTFVEDSRHAFLNCAIPELDFPPHHCFLFGGAGANLYMYLSSAGFTSLLSAVLGSWGLGSVFDTMRACSADC